MARADAVRRASAREVWARVRAERIESQSWPPVLRKGGLLIKKAVAASLLAGACFGAGLAVAQNVEVRATNVQVSAGVEIGAEGFRLTIGAAADSVAYGSDAVKVDKDVAAARKAAEAVGMAEAKMKSAASSQAEAPDYLRPAKGQARAAAETACPELR